jgi:fatty acid kinase fatty acid binding subunit
MIGVEASKRVKVVVDTSTCIDSELAQRNDMTLVPLHIQIDGRDLRDVEDIRPHEVYQALREGVDISTSSASPGDYLSAFELAGDLIFCPTMAASVSAMHEAASIAAGMVSRAEVRVFDTGTAAGGLRLIALRAAQLAFQGSNLDEIESWARSVRQRIEMMGVLETVRYLARSGRVPQVAAWGGSVLKVRPVVRFSGGSGSLVTMVRGDGWVLRELEKQVRDSARKQSAASDGQGLVCTIFHADALELATQFHTRLEQQFPAGELSVSEFTPAMGVHTGPGLVGFALYVER